MSDMIIDIHTHVFPHQGGPAGYKDDPQRYLRSQRDFLHKLWGRLVTSTPDEKFIPWPGENVDFRVGKYGKWLWTKHGKECWMQRFPVLMVEAEWPPENMLAFMDAAGVDKAVLHAGYMERNYSLELLTDCMKKFPGRFFGTVSINYDIEKSEEHREAELNTLRDSITKLGMRGIFPGRVREQNIEDEKFEPLWEEISRLKVPFYFCPGFQPKKRYIKAVEQIEKVLRKHPDMKMIIDHLGGNIRPQNHPDFTDTPKDLFNLLRLPNVYFEVGYVLAFLNWDVWKENFEYPYPLHKKIIKQIYNEVGSERLLWGTDMPNTYRTCTYEQCRDLVRLHFDFMSEDERNMVLGGNAAKLFRI